MAIKTHLEEIDKALSKIESLELGDIESEITDEISNIKHYIGKIEDDLYEADDLLWKARQLID